MDLDRTTTRLATRWGLELGAPFEGGSSAAVLRCRWPDGTPAVLKVGEDRALGERQHAALALFAPSGRVPAVLAFDEESGAVVLEEVRPGTLAEDLPAHALPALWAGLLAALHGVGVPERIGTLRERCEEAFARVGRRLHNPVVAARISPLDWTRAMQKCARLLDTTRTPVLLHGDLHPGNALDGGPARGLLAVDPKTCVGDPCFDAVDLVVMGAGHEGVEARCAAIAAACDLDGDRLFAWARVIAPFFVVAHATNGAPEPVVDELVQLLR
ncbi:aminoglycoside phosphotransferase family protein [Lentzea guizhouensis]|uniref:aminoglycoside phosphotransferase family protein n=1 Tax=Lentzea guizhouensis TaxID=1586287 RepID=UPI000A6143B6|nr:aminoglycoside phosphotransferase family protein [Lentzea guizhouensis]